MEKGRHPRFGVGFLLASALVSLASLVGAQAGPEVAPVKVSAGGFGLDSVSNYPTLIALQKGFFAKEGLAVTYTRSYEQMQALIGGSFDVIDDGSDGPILVADKGGDIVIVYDVTHKPSQFMVLGPGINSVEELEGKPIGVWRIPSPDQTLLKSFFAKQGKDPNKVTFVRIGGSRDRYAALQAGRINATVLSPDFAYHARQQGMKILATPRDWGVYPWNFTLAGRYMRLFWQPVYLGRDLPSGRAVPIRVMSEDFTLYRGESGAPHLLAFRCAHRGTQLSVGRVEEDCIRCFYHGWKYDGSGQCVEQPAEDPAFAAKVKIQSYPVKEYLGMIFAYLGEGASPPLPRYPHLEREGVLTVSKSVRPFNYFNNIENTVDLIHVAFVHRGTVLQDHGISDLLSVSAAESEWGLSLRAPGSNGAAKLDQFGMPNILSFVSQPDNPGGPWTETMTYKVPINDESFYAFAFSFAPVTGEAANRYKDTLTTRPGSTFDVTKLGQAILRGEAHVSDFVNHPEAIAIQDFVSQGGQGVVADRERERLGRSDEGVILLRKIWQRELKALAEGRPLKKWTPPAEMRVTSGVAENNRSGVGVR